MACQTQASKIRVTILDGEEGYTLYTSERTPTSWLTRAGLSLSPGDRLLYQGEPISPDEPLSSGLTYTLQIRRAVTVTLITPRGPYELHTAAWTVGEALVEDGFSILIGDRVSPPLETPLTAGMEISYWPGRDLKISVEGKEISIRSSASTVGQALAEAGLPLMALDYSLPREDEPLPADGHIRVARVAENVILSQKTIPYQSRFEASADLELDQTALLQPGEPGLAVSRKRIRLEDGVETAHWETEETLVRPPRDRVVGYGTKINVRTAVVDGVRIEYWRVLRMYATSYSPCRSGVPGQCYYYTASRKPVQKGVVAMRRSWYYLFRGQPLYIPGYGYATVEDVGAGFPDGRYWIDLGWSDEDYQPMGGWMTVYFLTPIPPNPVYLLP